MINIQYIQPDRGQYCSRMEQVTNGATVDGKLR